VSDAEACNDRTGRLAAVLMAGCLAAWPVGCAGTRLPSFRASSVQTQKREAELFYPFAEDSSGPTVGAQPREFSVQRSEATRLQRTDQYFLP
jgi:hypothetical protein